MNWPQCSAEVGKPGAFHGCNARAAITVTTRYGMLNYCKRHADRAGDRPQRPARAWEPLYR